jgi:hypothetical protein
MMTGGMMTGGMMTGGMMTGGATNGSDDGTCYEIEGCIAENACQDEACLLSCVEQASMTAQQQFVDYQTCAQMSGCAADNVECLLGACINQISACYTGTCLGISLCLQRINCSSADCATECLGMALPGAQQAFTGMQGCFANVVMAGTCTQTDSQCLQMNCSAEVMACQEN